MAQTIDVSGLPEAVVKDIRNLVDTLKSNTVSKEPRKLTPDEWIKEHTAWVNSHPPVTTFVDDSRESIYAGRGE